MTQEEGRTGTVRVPQDEVAALRRKLRLGPKEKIRLAYVAGPGDVIGSHERWVEGRLDERLPVLAYSTMFYDLVEALDAQGIVCHMTDEKPSGESPIRFAHTPMPAHSGAAGYFLAKRRHAVAVSRALRPFAPHLTIIGADHHWPALWTWPGRPILSVHNTFWPADRLPGGAKAKTKRLLRRAAYARMRAAVSTSEACAGQMRIVTGRKTKLFVETPQLRHRPLPAEEGARRAHALLYVGRIEETKGVFDLLEAARALKSELPDLTLLYLGEGRALGRLRDDIGDEDWVSAPGRADGDAVLTHMAEASLLVCPTKRAFDEGLALVCIEAALAGTPVLASTVVPAAATLGRAAEVFEADDRHALLLGLERCLTDEAMIAAQADGLAALDAEKFEDRSLSWGSMAFKAMMVAADR